MDNRIRPVLEELREIIEKDPGLARYEGSAARLWHFLRAEIMRKKPGEIAEYLRRDDIKLSEAEGFGARLADRFFSPPANLPQSDRGGYLRLRQEALLYACIEMDAAMKCRGLSDPIKRRELSGKLRLWSVP